MTDRTPDTTTCRTCHREWASLTQAHCTRCHLHFSGDSTFTEHLQDTGRGKPSRCRTEEELLTGKPKSQNGKLRKPIAPKPERFGDVWRYADPRPEEINR